MNNIEYSNYVDKGHKGWRLVCTAASWIVLGFVDDDKAFFTSITLFVAPMVADYIETQNLIWFRQIEYNFAKAVIFVSLLIGFSGLVGVLKITNNEGELIITTSKYYILSGLVFLEVKTMWYILFIFVVLTFFDWFTRNIEN